MKKASCFVLLGIGCVSLVAAQQTGREYAQAIKVIEEKGGTIGYDEHAPGRPVFEVDIMFNDKVADEDLINLKPFRGLRRLFLEGTPITSKGLLQLDGIEHAQGFGPHQDRDR